MAGEEEEIEIRVQLRDELSAPARRAARAEKEVGDEALKATPKIEAFGESMDDAADDADELTRSLGRTEQAMQQSQRASKQLRDETGRFAKSEEDAAESTEKLTKAVKRAHNPFRTLFKWLKRLGSLAFFGIKWGLIAVGVGFLAKAVIGLGAAGFGAVAGLAPLTGMLIAYPGIIGSVVQSMATFKMATGGMGELIKVFSDPAATPEQIQEAMDNMSGNQIKFARAVAETNEQWKALKKTIGRKFFEDLDGVFRRLSKLYLPILNRQLGKNAEAWNRVIKYTDRWLETDQAQKDINRVMASNNVVFEKMGKGGVAWIQTFTILMRTAGPMLREMAGDFQSWSEGVAAAADANRGKLRKFFLGAYHLFQDVVEVLGNFIVGIYNIGKIAAGSEMTGMMGGSVKGISEDFRKWSGSDKGRKSIRKFFRDMKPVVQELGFWVRDLSIILGVSLPQSNGDFVKTSRYVRTQILPKVVDIVTYIIDKFVPVMEQLSDTYGDLKEAGITGGIGRGLGWALKFIDKFAELMAKLPEPLKDILAAVTTAAAIVGLVGGTKTLGAGARLLTGGKVGQGWGIQKVFVTNWPVGGVGGAPVAGGPGGGGGKPKGKFAKVRGAGRSIGRLILPIAVADAMYETLFDDLYGFVPKKKPKPEDQNKPGAATFGAGLNKANSDYVPKSVREDQKRETTESWFEMLARKAGKAQEAIRLHNLGWNKDEQTRRKELDKTGGAISGSMKLYEKWGGKVVDASGKAVNSLVNVKNAANQLPSQKTIEIEIKARQNRVAADWRFEAMENLYTGGATTTGRTYMTGEKGPEAFVTHSGSIRMLGLHGPEFARPGAGAVIPATATRDPWHGASGDAPEWAVRALQKAAGGGPRPMPSKASDRSTDTMPLPPINMQVYPQSEMDLSRAVRKGIRDAQREWEERQ